MQFWTGIPRVSQIFYLYFHRLSMPAPHAWEFCNEINVKPRSFWSATFNHTCLWSQSLWLHVCYGTQRTVFWIFSIFVVGAHSLGQCHLDHLGFKGPWDNDPDKMDNGYYKSLVGTNWVAVKTPSGLVVFLSYHQVHRYKCSPFTNRFWYLYSACAAKSASNFITVMIWM